jgi:hypothetical protein
MTTMFVRHKVTDYANWKRAYDAFDATRKKFGVTGASVYRDADDASNVIVTHTFKDTSSAKAFASSEAGGRGRATGNLVRREQLAHNVSVRWPGAVRCIGQRGSPGVATGASLFSLSVTRIAPITVVGANPRQAVDNLAVFADEISGRSHQPSPGIERSSP